MANSMPQRREQWLDSESKSWSQNTLRLRLEIPASPTVKVIAVLLIGSWFLFFLYHLFMRLCQSTRVKLDQFSSFLWWNLIKLLALTISDIKESIVHRGLVRFPKALKCIVWLNNLGSLTHCKHQGIISTLSISSDWWVVVECQPEQRCHQPVLACINGLECWDQVGNRENSMPLGHTPGELNYSSTI